MRVHVFFPDSGVYHGSIYSLTLAVILVAGEIGLKQTPSQGEWQHGRRGEAKTYRKRALTLYYVLQQSSAFGWWGKIRGRTMTKDPTICIASCLLSHKI